MKLGENATMSNRDEGNYLPTELRPLYSYNEEISFDRLIACGLFFRLNRHAKMHYGKQPNFLSQSAVVTTNPTKFILLQIGIL